MRKVEKDKNTVFYDVFASWAQQKIIKNILKKQSKTDFQKNLMILAFFFPAPDPQKRENTGRVKFFLGVGGSAR
jgi:hypothetical protein